MDRGIHAIMCSNSIKGEPAHEKQILHISPYFILDPSRNGILRGHRHGSDRHVLGKRHGDRGAGRNEALRHARKEELFRSGFQHLHAVSARLRILREQTGERVDDAEYARDRKVEELLGVKLNYITEPGDWSGKDTFNGKIKQSVMAGDGEYDLVDGMIAVTNMIVPDGVFLNLMEQDGLDFSDPWWAKDITADLDSDGKYTENDRYGLALDNVNMRGFHSSLELPVISKGANGELEYIGFTERFSNAVDTWVSLSGDKKMVWCTGGDGDQRDVRIRMFKADQALFAGETILEVEDFRDMASDFGMIPQPKYDESQENYHVQIGTGSGMYFIPKTVKNPEMTVDVMNAINCISMEDVVPAYYEYALKEKFMRDEKNKEVIDIINSSMMMDVNFAFASTMGVNFNTIYVEIVNNRSDPASTFEKSKKKFEAGIEKLTETFEGLE